MTRPRFFSASVRPYRLFGLTWLAVLALTLAAERALVVGVPTDSTAAALVDFAQGGSLPVDLFGGPRNDDASWAIRKPSLAQIVAPKRAEIQQRFLAAWHGNTPTPDEHAHILTLEQETAEENTLAGRSPQVVRAKAQAIGLLRHEAVRTTLEDLYQVDPDNANKVWAAVLKETKGTAVNPLLMMAVIAQESHFDPNASSQAGAKGLTQVIPRWHQEKLKPGDQLTSIPVSVRVGVHVLNDYLKSTDGNVILALQKYNGSSKDRSHRYARRVFRKEQTLAKAILERSNSSSALGLMNGTNRIL